MLSVSLEAAELLELGQWKDDAALEAALAKPDFRRRLGDECAAFFLLMVCERAGIDFTAAADAKFDANAGRHPAKKARGNEAQRALSAGGGGLSLGWRSTRGGSPAPRGG
jgi:hypothetical protein